MNHSPTEGAQGSANSGTPTHPGFDIAQCQAIADDLRILEVEGAYPSRLGASDPERIEWLIRQLAQSEERVALLEGALRDAIASGQTVVNMMHECADPKLQRPFVWKDVALQMYACFADLAKWRALLSSSKTN